MTEHAVTVLISRRVREGAESDFERTTLALMESAERFKGFLGAHLVRPGEDPEAEDTMYHVILAFDHQSNLDTWHDSPERRRGLAASAPFIEGLQSFRPMSGLGLWFRMTQASPPRWKVAVVTWLGICPTVYLLFFLTAGPLRSWALLPRTVVLTIAVVIIMTWIVAPQLTRLLKPWLYASGSRR